MVDNSSFGLMTFVIQKFATILDAPVEIKEEIKEIKERTYFAQIELMCGNALLLAVAFDSLNVDSSAFLQRMKGCFAKQNKLRAAVKQFS